MSYLYECLFILFNIISLLLYACCKVINNIQLWALEQIDLLTDERDGLKDRYKDAKDYIGELKDKIDDLKKKDLERKLVMMILKI